MSGEFGAAIMLLAGLIIIIFFTGPTAWQNFKKNLKHSKVK